MPYGVPSASEKFGYLPGIHGAIRFSPGREILRREQLAGVVFPAVHEKSRRFRVFLQESKAGILRSERPRVLVVTAEQTDPKDQKGGKKNGGDCRKEESFQKITSQGE